MTSPVPRYYRNHTAHAPAAAVARQYLVIGPWDHGGAQMPEKTIAGLAIPDAAVIEMKKLQADWYDWALGRAALPGFFRDHVAYFMMGADQWRYAPTLDSASSDKELVLNLHSAHGTPGNLLNPGMLSTSAPGKEAATVLISDPRELPELEVAAAAKDENLGSQFRSFQKRALVFRSEPFAHRSRWPGTCACYWSAPPHAGPDL
jgi:predicted acyl esterase